jgi:hypothetical protein
MSIPKIKTDISNSIKGIDIKLAGFRRRLYMNKQKKGYISRDELIDYIDINSYTMLPEILGNYEELREINIEDIKILCYYWIDDERTIQESVNLDSYYGIIESNQDDDIIDWEPSLYRYTLNIGGKKHGKFIMNAEHPDNDNTSDIVYQLDPDSTYEYMYFKEIAEISQRYYDKVKKQKIKYKIQDMYIKKYIRNHQIELITEVYRKLASNYSLILSYNKPGNQLYDAMIRQSEKLLDQATRELNKPDTDPEYSRLCTELYDLIVMVKSNMSEWYKNAHRCVYRIANDKVVSDVRHHILSFV